MKKRQNNSARASALQVSISVALLCLSAILFASSFRAAPEQQSGAQQTGFYPPLPNQIPDLPHYPPSQNPPEQAVAVTAPTFSMDVSDGFVVNNQPVAASNIDPNLNYIGFQADMLFDSAVAAATPATAPVTATDLTSNNWTVSGNTLNTGPGTFKTIRVSAFSNDGITPLSGAGNLYNIKWKRVSTTPGQSTTETWSAFPNDFEFIDTDLNTTSASPQNNGTITITGPTPTPAPATATPTPLPPTPTATPTLAPTASPSPTPGPPKVSAPIFSMDTSDAFAVNNQPVTTTFIDPSLNYIGFQGDLVFDSAVAAPTPMTNPVTAGGLTASNWTVSGNVLLTCNNLPCPGTMRTLRVSAFSNDGITPLSGAGTLYIIKWKRVSTNPGDTSALVWQPFPNDFEFIDVDLNSFSPPQNNGMITITGATPTPTDTPTPPPTASPTPTPPPTASPTPTSPPTATPTIAPTASPTATPPPTATPGATPCVGILLENFDSVVAPALPAGWVATNAAGPAPLWVTSNAGTPAPAADSPPNAAFVNDASVVSDKRLDAPAVMVSNPAAQLAFRNNYTTENGFDGGVLEISIGGGAFTDIVAAGGTFITGGYNGVISTAFGSPIAGRAAWTGTSGGFITTALNLPPSAAGQTVVMRWRMGSDSSVSAAGWRIDTIGYFCDGGFATPTPTPTASPSPTLPPTPTPPPCGLSEGFDDITTLVPGGWFMQNNSQPGPGTTGWFQGNSTVFPAQSGAPTSYIGANFNNGTGTSTLSNWLLTPVVPLENGDQLTFWTRTTTGTFPDRLQVRMSTNGSSTDVGATATSTGDFTTLLLDINPTYTAAGYPIVWTQFTATISGLGSSTTGRLAFRYFVENGGPAGANSDYIGIDSVVYGFTCPTPTPTPAPTASPSPTPPPTASPTPTLPPTATPAPTASPTPTTPPPTASPSPSPTPTPIVTPTPAPTATPIPPTPSPSPTPSATVVPGSCTVGGHGDMQFEGHSSTSGAAGNVRTFTKNGVTIKASAFSRTAGGVWSTAYLGLYDKGLGVTSTGENPATDFRVDNAGGSVDYILFEVSGTMGVNELHIKNILNDSDLRFWLGTLPDPINNHNTLSDAFLAMIGPSEDNLSTSTGDHEAHLNGGDPPTGPVRTGNVFVVAALPTDTNDAFLVDKVEWDCPPGCPTITVNPDHLDPATIGKSYDKDINAGGGHGPYTFAVTGGSLPPGLHLDPDSHLRGTPTTTGTYTFTITATDSAGCMGSRTYTMTVSCPTINLNPGSLPNGKILQAYSKVVTGSGGTSPYSFSLASGSLPPGLTLSASGTVSGTPTALGTYTFSIKATDALGCMGTKAYTITVTN